MVFFFFLLVFLFFFTDVPATLLSSSSLQCFQFSFTLLALKYSRKVTCKRCFGGNYAREGVVRVVL
jgi:hypothetical protein